VVANGGPVLSNREVALLRSWVAVAGTWSEAAQGLVGAASTLATTSCDLGDVLEREAAVRDGPGAERVELAGQLRLLADKVEDETAGLRRHFLAMAADLEQYRSLAGDVGA
jgi:hypothetical protein